MTTARERRIITFMSDFGLGDWFVAAVKGEILKKNRFSIIDITHTLGPFAIREAAFILKNVYRSFPTGTVHLAVVDPGVGSIRRPLIVCSKGHYFIGPDNGIFSYVLGPGASAYEIVVKGNVSGTFHARDIFAPTAARLASGVGPRALGKTTKSVLRFDLPVFQRKARLVSGEVIYVDRFGNLIANIPNKTTIRRLRIGKFLANAGSFYSQAKPGQLIAVRGSTGYYEIAVNRGSAAKKTGAEIGTKVRGDI